MFLLFKLFKSEFSGLHGLKYSYKKKKRLKKKIFYLRERERARGGAQGEEERETLQKTPG